MKTTDVGESREELAGTEAHGGRLLTSLLCLHQRADVHYLFATLLSILSHTSIAGNLFSKLPILSAQLLPHFPLPEPATSKLEGSLSVPDRQPKI